MLQNWLILSPEILIVLFWITSAIVNKYRDRKTPKTFFTLSRWFLLAIIAATLVFYNKSAFPQILNNTSFSTLFKLIAYLLLLAWNYLSSKWFLNKNRPSYKFCSLIFVELLGLDILASANSLPALTAAVAIICLANHALIYRHWDIEKVTLAARLYILYSIFFIGSLIIATLYLYYQSGSFEYAQIKNYLSQQITWTLSLKLCIVAIIAALMFIMSAAPFHLWFINFIRCGVLPLSGFITLVPWMISLCALINLLRNCLLPMADFINPLLFSFGLCSVILGALGAWAENNLRCLFACINVYCLGFALIGLNNCTNTDIIAVFAYSVTCLLSLAGVYTVFLGFKSHGEYLSNLSELNGFYTLRPYMSAALLIFIFSLIGLAPTLGFFGYLSVLHNLAFSSDWLKLGILLISALIVSGALFRVIKSIYFISNNQKYDRPDKSIYICLFINIMIIVTSLFFPSWLIGDALRILGGNS